MQITPIKTRVFHPNENLFDFIIEHISPLESGSILVITSKIVSLSEGRIKKFTSKDEKENIIKDESDFAMKTEYVWLTIKDKMLMATAGIDESNAAEGSLILLPKDSFQAAIDIREKLMDYYNLNELGVVITDSKTMPMRKGAIGVAYGYAGIKPLHSYIGEKDLFDREFKVSMANIVDGLAASAVLAMGEGTEQQPLAIIKEAPVEWTNEIPNDDEMKVNPDDDLYAPYFRRDK